MRTFRGVDVAVVVPTRDRWETLQRCLDALAAQTAQGFEIVVSVDGEAAARPSDPSVTFVTGPQRGPAAARNRGVAATQRPLVLFLGDDVFLAPTGIEAHLSRHNAEPDESVAVLGRVDWHPEVARDRINRWLDWSGTQFDYRVIEASPLDDLRYGRFFTSNVSLKRSMFVASGGFDEEFPYAAYEDIELGYRLAGRGMVLRYEPSAEAVHHHRYDWQSIIRRFQAVARSERMMVRKHPDFPPFFLNRLSWLEDAPPPARVWPLVVDLVPERAGRLRRLAEERADRWYCQQLAGVYVDAWEGERGLEELREYLGDSFDERRLHNHAAEVDAEEGAAADEGTFYRTSEAYLYDLTVFAMSGTKAPYRQVLRQLVRPPARVLDYGCGIGSDGLQLAERGYDVAFADFDNPSTRFLRWRLAQRGLDAPVHDIDDSVPGDFDLAFAFDVIEHVDDPFAFLREMETRASIVLVNLLEPEPADTHLHRPLPIKAILEHAEKNDLVFRGLFHARSHLIAYRPR